MVRKEASTETRTSDKKVKISLFEIQKNFEKIKVAKIEKKEKN